MEVWACEPWITVSKLATAFRSKSMLLHVQLRDSSSRFVQSSPFGHMRPH